MLTRLLGVAFFMRGGSVPVRFGGFIVMHSCFVVIVFGHYGCSRAFQWPMPVAEKKNSNPHQLNDTIVNADQKNDSSLPSSGRLRGPVDLWGSPSPLILAALDDPNHGLLVLDSRLRLVHLTSSLKSLLGLPEDLMWQGLDVREFLNRADLDAGSVASTESAILEAHDHKLLESVHILSGDKSREIRMRVRNIGLQHLAATFSPVAGHAMHAADVPKGESPDALTGLFTRSHFEKAAVEALTHAVDRTVAILLIDLDRFKPVNDTLGHAAGDAVLRLVAQRLKSVLRESDLVARLGGDEFALLIHPLSTVTRPAEIARRIVDLIGRTYLVDGHLVNVGASVGIALSPKDGTRYDNLLRCADLALYHSKTTGRGTYHFFSPAMEGRAQARRTGELDLRRALALRQFEVHYQPQVDTYTRSLVGFEALVRWRHPERGLIPPGDFLALAEEIGVIIPMGEWVLRTACREAMNWPDNVVLAVNASPIQFETGRFADSVRSASRARNFRRAGWR